MNFFGNFLDIAGFIVVIVFSALACSISVEAWLYAFGTSIGMAMIGWSRDFK